MINRRARQEGLAYLCAVKEVGGPLQISNKLAMFCQIISRDVDLPSEEVTGRLKKCWLQHICRFISKEVLFMSCICITYYIV